MRFSDCARRRSATNKSATNKSTTNKSTTNNLPTGHAKRRSVQAMFDTIAPRYDLLNRLLTLRLDIRWRRSTVTRLRLPPQSRVADLGCGTGDFCRELTARGHTALGLDMSMGMLRASTCPVSPLVHADVLALPLADNCIDGATCGFVIRNLVDITTLFAELARVVRPGGRIALLEVDEPSNPLLRYGHRLYFGRIVPFVGAILSDGTAYRYLPQSVAYLPPAQELVSELSAAGFDHIRHRRLTGGIVQLFTATRKQTYL